MKRQLNDDEVAMINRSIPLIKKEMEWLSAQSELFNLQINKLLKLNYERALAELENKLREVESLLEQHTRSLEILDDQIKNGVIIKDHKEIE